MLILAERLKEMEGKYVVCSSGYDRKRRNCKGYVQKTYR